MAKKRGKKKFKKEETNAVGSSNNIKIMKPRVKQRKASKSNPDPAVSHAEASEATTSEPADIKKKKPKVKRRKASKPNPALAVPHAHASEATTSEPATRKDGEPSKGIEKEQGIQKRVSGFIFMCNPTTKLECFQYRVFGLPMGQREVVEEIKPGAKLFLYDFELKLLYGVYEATSSGQLNLEPSAFGGKYPAQVKFKIYKECLPLAESVLKQVIKENYSGSKFKQELCVQQVKKLSSSFQPLAAPSYLASRAPRSVPQLWPIPPPATQNQFNHTVRFLPTEPRYVHAAPAGPASMQGAHEAQYLRAELGRAPVEIAQDMRYARGALQGPTPVQTTRALQQHYRPASDVGMAHVHITFGHQSLPATGRYYVPDSERPYYSESRAREVQQPYPRAREERALPGQVISLGRQSYQLPSQSEPIYKDNAAGYNSHRHASATKYTTSDVRVAQAPSAVQPQLASGRPLGLLHYYSQDRATR